MNCDQVFDILTRGPFPTGTAIDAGVETHLDACAECRRLAEALRPAIELFQEAIGPEESRDLPGYWCAMATDRKQPVVSYAEDRPPRSLLPRAAARKALDSLGGQWSALTVWRMAAMLALGVTLGSLVNSRLASDGPSSLPPLAAGAGRTVSHDDNRSNDGHDHAPRYVPVRQTGCTRELLDSKLLDGGPADPMAAGDAERSNDPETSRSAAGREVLLAQADFSVLDCCSRCHNAISSTAPGVAAVQVTQQCQLCHRE